MTDRMDGYQGRTGQHDFASGRGGAPGQRFFLGPGWGGACIPDGYPVHCYDYQSTDGANKERFLTQIEYFQRNYRRHSFEFPIFQSIIAHSVQVFKRTYENFRNLKYALQPILLSQDCKIRNVSPYGDDDDDTDCSVTMGKKTKKCVRLITTT